MGWSSLSWEPPNGLSPHIPLDSRVTCPAGGGCGQAHEGLHQHDCEEALQHLTLCQQPGQLQVKGAPLTTSAGSETSGTSQALARAPLPGLFGIPSPRTEAPQAPPWSPGPSDLVLSWQLSSTWKALLPSPAPCLKESKQCHHCHQSCHSVPYLTSWARASTLITVLLKARGSPLLLGEDGGGGVCVCLSAMH